MALFWSRKSRAAALEKDKLFEDRNIRLIEQRIRVHSMSILETNPDVQYFIYGHYHHPLETLLSGGARQFVLGDWLTHFTYAVFDGNTLALKTFV
jgi:UDP-2,3-diacylglucosamine hydrolase